VSLSFDAASRKICGYLGRRIQVGVLDERRRKGVDVPVNERQQTGTSEQDSDSLERLEERYCSDRF